MGQRGLRRKIGLTRLECDYWNPPVEGASHCRGKLWNITECFDIQTETGNAGIVCKIIKIVLDSEHRLVARSDHVGEPDRPTVGQEIARQHAGLGDEGRALLDWGPAVTEGPQVCTGYVVEQSKNIGSRERHITTGVNEFLFQVDPIITQFPEPRRITDNPASAFFP